MKRNIDTKLVKQQQYREERYNLMFLAWNNIVQSENKTIVRIKQLD